MYVEGRRKEGDVLYRVKEEEGREREVKSQMRKSTFNICEVGFLIRGNRRLQEEIFILASLMLEDT